MISMNVYPSIHVIIATRVKVHTMSVITVFVMSPAFYGQFSLEILVAIQSRIYCTVFIRIETYPLFLEGNKVINIFSKLDIVPIKGARMMS